MKFLSMLIFCSTSLAVGILALPVAIRLPDNRLATHDTLSPRQIISAVFRGLAKVPEKLGKKVGKEQGKNTADTNGVDVQKVANIMAANFAKAGQPQNMECLLSMVTHMAQYGGSNAPWPCTLPSAEKAKEIKMMEDAKKKAFGNVQVDPHSIGAQMAAARAKAKA